MARESFIMSEKINNVLTENEKKELVSKIENFLSKYWAKCVESLIYEWTIINIYVVKVLIESVNEIVKNFWTFEAIANVVTSEQSTSVTIEKKMSLVGNVQFVSRENSSIDKTLIPEVKNIVITQIKG